MHVWVVVLDIYCQTEWGVEQQLTPKGTPAKIAEATSSKELTPPQENVTDRAGFKPTGLITPVNDLNVYSNTFSIFSRFGRYLWNLFALWTDLIPVSPSAIV